MEPNEEQLLKLLHNCADVIFHSFIHSSAVMIDMNHLIYTYSSQEKRIVKERMLTLAFLCTQFWLFFGV